MKIIAIERELPVGTEDAFKRFAIDEAAVLYELYKIGIVRELYFHADRNEAVLVLEAESIDDARDRLSRLPFVLNGLITFDFVPLRPYPGFERLFASSQPIP